MKLYVDIIMSGEKFNPEYYINQYGVYFRKYNKRGDYNKRLQKCENEGYGILSNDDNDTSEAVISKVLYSYEKIREEVEKEITFKEFNLIIESKQNTFSISLDNFTLIKKSFSSINISFIEEKD